MNSQQFYLFNLIIFIILLLYFWFGRPKSKVTLKLNLRDQDQNDESILTEKRPENENLRLKLAKEVNETTQLTKSAPMLSQKKSVFFIYNGHEWDAYEVLGVPKGSTLPIVTSQYQNLIKTSDPSTFEFFEAAYTTILKSK